MILAITIHNLSISFYALYVYIYTLYKTIYHTLYHNLIYLIYPSDFLAWGTSQNKNPTGPTHGAPLGSAFQVTFQVMVGKILVLVLLFGTSRLKSWWMTFQYDNPPAIITTWEVIQHDGAFSLERLLQMQIAEDDDFMISRFISSKSSFWGF